MIEQKLRKQLKVSEDELGNESIISGVKLLLEDNSKEDHNLLERAFPASSNQKLVNLNAEKATRERLATKHKGDIYNIDEIKSICLKYRLRFLSTKYYKGPLPVEVLHNLKNKLNKENGLAHLMEGSSSDYEDNLFIIAPASMFELESGWENKKGEIREARRLRNLDPALFIKVDNDRYVFVKEWGNSFSQLRRVLGMFTAKTQAWNRMFFLAWLAFTFLCTKASIYLWGLTTDKFTWYTPIAALFSLVSFVCIISWICSSGDGFFLGRWKDKTNHFWTMDKNLASENNWDKTTQV